MPATSSDAAVRRVVVLGGGSAGWLTAGVLAAGLGPAVSITVVESPDIAPIGVGEGTWPTMRDTLQFIGVRETDFVRECDAAFKQGSLFRRWREDRPDDRYLHPFSLPHGHLDAPVAATWNALGAAAPPFAELVSAQGRLWRHGLAPKQPATPEYAAVLNYGYHFDAGRLGAFLREHCCTRLGVRHVADEVVAVRGDPAGDIEALSTREHGDLEAELFVDCSGQAARLLAGHYGVGFVSQRAVLACDRALALQLPYAQPDAPIACHTVSTATPLGWVWDIGLQQRRGVGLVYASAHCSDAEAEAVLADYLQTSLGEQPGQLPAPRRLQFEPGHRERFWHRNCIAIGQAAGFLEPLEASALALVEASAHWLCEQFPPTRAAIAPAAQRFNAAFAERWQRIIEFLKLHYLLSRREGPFWEAQRAAAGVPERLQQMLQWWRHAPPSRHDLARHDEPFPSASWQYVLYGMGWHPDALLAPPPAARARAEASFDAVDHLAATMAAALPGHRTLIEHIRRHGLKPL